jgi:hypothetical protein
VFPISARSTRSCERPSVWGGMPHHLVEADLANGTLVPLKLAESDALTSISMSAIYRTDTPPGLAGRGLIDRRSAEGTQTSDRKAGTAGAAVCEEARSTGAQAGLIMLRRLGSAKQRVTRLAVCDVRSSGRANSPLPGTAASGAKRPFIPNGMP